MKISLTILLLIFTAFAFSAIYEYKSSDGSTAFTDQKVPKSKKVKLLPETISEKKNITKKTPEKVLIPKVKVPEKPQETKHVGYEKMSFTNLKDGHTFWNQRKIPISISLSPKLQEGDKIQLKVDGSDYGKAAATTSFMLHNLNRGTHTVSADVIDKNGRVIKSLPSHTVYIHYAALGGV